MGVLALVEYFMMIMVTKMILIIKMMMRIIRITLRKYGSFGFPAAPVVALLSLLVPEIVCQMFDCLSLLVFDCHCLSLFVIASS